MRARRFALDTPAPRWFVDGLVRVESRRLREWRGGYFSCALLTVIIAIWSLFFRNRHMGTNSGEALSK